MCVCVCVHGVTAIEWGPVNTTHNFTIPSVYTSVSVCVYERVCVCVCVRERERAHEHVCRYDCMWVVTVTGWGPGSTMHNFTIPSVYTSISVCMGVCVCVCVCVSAHAHMSRCASMRVVTVTGWGPVNIT